MFATLAPRLRDNGWASVFPVANPGKHPLISGWQAYNRAAPTEVEVDLWCSAHPCLIGALEPLCGRLGPKHRQPVASPAYGRVAQWLKALNDIDGTPVDLCRAAVEAAPEGDRYPTAFSAIVALVRIGFTDAEIIKHIVEPYLARYDQRSLPDRQRAIMSGLRWAREQIGPDAEAIAAAMRSDQIFARWRARWQRGR